MRILILGSTGMLGHRLWMTLSQTHETWGTVRGDAALPPLPGIDRDRICAGVDALKFDSVVEAFAAVRPEVVINCVGLIKQHELAEEALPAIDLNARFPHQVASLCRATQSRMIHISTDCVFSGQKGNYTEADPTDAHDVYGKTKALGEVTQAPHALTIRTSLIGRELATRYSLVEWFLSQSGPIKGYQRAIFSGFTTQVFAEVLRDYVLPDPDLHGLYHVSCDPISKYDLLQLLNQVFERRLDIASDTEVVIDRSLDSGRFRARTGFTPPAWPDMIDAMAADPTPYEEWKS